MSGLSSYGSIYALGHIAVENIFDGDTEITEKIDGSQISFGVIDGELMVRSKNSDLLVGNNNMFYTGIEAIQQRAGLLQPNWVYRGEYLMKPKHNTLNYDRVPKDNIIIFDIERGAGTQDYLRWRERNEEAERIGFEAVPNFATTATYNLEYIKKLLEIESVLGGVKIEGVVVKNYSQFTEDKKIAKAKFVSAEFQEKHQKEWKVSNPTRKDIVEEIIEELRTEARWKKSVQHLRDDGKLEGSPRDIGMLIKETQNDILAEEENHIKETLYNHFKGQIMRGVVRGLPDAYKLWLAEGEIRPSVIDELEVCTKCGTKRTGAPEAMICYHSWLEGSND